MAFCAKRETTAKRETRGGEKNEAPVASPLFWLFRPRLRPQILTEGGHIKRTDQKLKTISINRQQHKPQETNYEDKNHRQ